MLGVQVSVEVLCVLRVEEEVPTAYSGDNIKLRLKGIEEEVSTLPKTSSAEYACQCFNLVTSCKKNAVTRI